MEARTGEPLYQDQAVAGWLAGVVSLLRTPPSGSTNCHPLSAVHSIVPETPPTKRVDRAGAVAVFSEPAFPAAGFRPWQPPKWQPGLSHPSQMQPSRVGTAETIGVGTPIYGIRLALSTILIVRSRLSRALD